MIMIKLFTQAGCNSSRKARQWFRDHGIAFEEKNFSSTAPTISELKQILCLTENGLDDIISTRSQLYPTIADKLPDMTFNETLQLLCEHPQLLRRPIIVGRNKLQVGFNDDDIRQFIPRHIRRISFQRTLVGLVDM
ncbi:negative regulator of proteolysis [Lactiplantibacillus paraplantarum]|nr:negative regulator of proteolysis [Lactiplantibacillus paraplantarum]KRL51474.1 negative regulator of proteolysis [Lactiplantibacillus paraplantarum DSM 10667]